MWRTKLIVSLAIAAALACCRPAAEEVADGDDPLLALAAPAPSTRYDGVYWAREAHRGSLLWRRAQGLCRERQAEHLPNCATIALVRRWEEPVGLPPLPAPPPLPSLHAAPVRPTGGPR